VRVIQSALGSLLPLMILFFGGRLFKRKVALTAAIVAVFYPTFIYYDASLLITSLMTLLSVLVVWQTVRTERKPTLWRFVTLGALIGLAALARPNILMFLPALGIWFWLIVHPQLHNRIGATFFSYVVVVFSAIVVIAPVTIHNWIVSGEFIPISWQGGYNFYLGNNHQANGWSATAPGIKSSWQGGYLDAINIAQSETARTLNEKQIDKYWWSRGWDEVSAHPWQTFKLFVKKIAYLINGFEIPNNQNIYIVERFSPLAQAMFARSPLYIPFGIIAPFALCGLSFVLRRATEYLSILLFLLSYGFSIVMFFVCARYRQPLLPFVLLLASFGLYEIISLIRSRKWKRLAPYAVALAGFFALSNSDIVGLDAHVQSAMDHFLLGSSYQQQGDIANAEREYHAALTDDPQFIDAHNNLGLIAAQRGEADSAERHFRQVLRSEPDNSTALTNLAMVMMKRDELPKAAKLLERAQHLDPLDYNVQYRLGLVYHLQERFRLARDRYLKTLELNPNFEPAKRNLQIVEEVLRDSL